MIVPKTGMIVLYSLNASDVGEIERQRRYRVPGPTGNSVRPGDIYPLLITEDWQAQLPNQAVNGQVFLDGPDSLWVTSRRQADDGRRAGADIQGLWFAENS